MRLKATFSILGLTLMSLITLTAQTNTESILQSIPDSCIISIKMFDGGGLDWIYYSINDTCTVTLEYDLRGREVQCDTICVLKE